MTETMGDYEGFGGNESAERNDDAFQEITPDKAIHRAVEKVFLEMSGVLSDEDGITKAINYIGGMCDVKSVLRYAISLDYKKQKQIRSIEKHSSSQDTLFPDDLMEKIVSYTTEDGQASSVKYRDCQYRHHLFSREQQIRNMRRLNKSFDRSEERRQQIMPILEKDQLLTTIDAISQLDEKSKKRKAA